MQTHELLFELSHPVRYEITKLLAESPHRLTKIGEHVDANNPEVSRHLDRLKNADIVAKNADGYYSTTSFGKLIISMLPGLSFLADHPGFFLEHDLSLLPVAFINRLGELSNSTFTEGTINNFGISTRMVHEAKERVYLVTKEIPSDTTSFHTRVFEGVDMKVIRYEGTAASCDDEECQDREFRERLRFLQVLPAIMVLTEKEGAIMFPNQKGAFDFAAGFNSIDPEFRNWCEDLFEYLWKMGSTIDEYVD